MAAQTSKRFWEISAVVVIVVASLTAGLGLLQLRERQQRIDDSLSQVLAQDIAGAKRPVLRARATRVRSLLRQGASARVSSGYFRNSVLMVAAASGDAEL